MTYEENSAIRASELIDFAKHPSIYYNRYILNKITPPNIYMLRGSIVDMFLTEPTRLKEEVYILEASMPTPQMLTFCNILVELGSDSIENQKRAYERTGVKNMGFDKFAEKYKFEGKPYYTESVLAAEKKYAITRDLYDECALIAQNISTSVQYTEIYTARMNGCAYYQPEIFFTLQHDEQFYALKTKPDFIVVDPTLKTITPWDLKIKDMFVEEFSGDFRNRKYYLQGAMQYMGTKHFLYSDEFKERFGDPKEYTLQHTKYLVYFLPLSLTVTFCMTELDFVAATYGSVSYSGYETKGVLTLLEDLFWHKEHNLWSMEKSFYVANGDIPLDVFKNDSLQHDLEKRIFTGSEPSASNT